jgi:hypothetical protein
MIAVDVVVVVVLVIVTECDILPSHLQQTAVTTLGIKINTAAVCFLSDIKALCRLVHRINVTHSANRPQAWRPSGGK